MATTPLRFVVADDSPLYREAVSSILQKRTDLQVVAGAEDRLAAVQAVERHRPDVVLMDISMPVIVGFDATWIIRPRFPDVRVIVLTMHGVESISEAACKAGACWCLNKACSPREIFQAIKTTGI